MRVTDVRVDPRPVAIARIGLGLAVVISALEVSVILLNVAQGRLRFPVYAWLPAPTEAAVTVYLALAVSAGLALAVGYRAAAAAGVSAGLGVVALLWDQQTYSSHLLLITLLVTYLAFAQSDTRWSAWRARPRRELVRWWPQLLMMTQVSVCYLFAGLSKVNGTYLDGGPLGLWLWVAVPAGLLPVMAVASVLTELFLAVGLWLRPTRLVAAGAGLALHVSIVIGMAADNLVLFAFALACVPTYALFLTRPSLRGDAATAASRLPSTART
jgi:hypothetical protein